jgi:hypothetical protein
VALKQFILRSTTEREPGSGAWVRVRNDRSRRVKDVEQAVESGAARRQEPQRRSYARP